MFSLDLGTVSTVIASLAALFSVIWMIKTSRTLKSTLAEYKPFIERIEELISFEETDDGQLTLDAGLVKMIDALGSRITKSFTMQGLAQLSGKVRMEKGLKGAMAADIVEQKMPILNLIGDFLGINTLNYVKKHPDAMGQILQMAGPAIQKFMNRGNNGGQPQTRDGYM